MVKSLPAMWETRVPSLSQEDPLEKEMATHSSILAWKTPWMEEPDGLQFMDHRQSDMTELLNNSRTLTYVYDNVLKNNVFWVPT